MAGACGGKPWRAPQHERGELARQRSQSSEERSAPTSEAQCLWRHGNGVRRATTWSEKRTRAGPRARWRGRSPRSRGQASAGLARSEGGLEQDEPAGRRARWCRRSAEQRARWCGPSPRGGGCVAAGRSGARTAQPRCPGRDAASDLSPWVQSSLEFGSSHPPAVQVGRCEPQHCLGVSEGTSDWCCLDPKAAYKPLSWSLSCHST